MIKAFRPVVVLVNINNCRYKNNILLTRSLPPNIQILQNLSDFAFLYNPVSKLI